MIFVIVTFLCVLNARAEENDTLLVETEQGTLVGTEMENKVNNEIYYAFFNIPFAQPPVGDKRFKEPLPPLPWDGVRDATEQGNACMSMHPIFQSIDGDEDCLNLNIYTPKPPSELVTSPLPIIVWIHGGAFHSGSNNPLSYGPDFFMMSGTVIIVAINYRVNVFGFLSLQNEEVPGNNGLKDQIMALKWLKANIRSFGGDPDSVTIMGESAGAASVHYMMLTRAANGLFNRAIMQSGVAINPWASTNQTLSTALKLGKVFNCGTDDLKELLKCLRGVNAEELVKYQYNVIALSTSSEVDVRIFLPCVEPPNSKHPILTTDPRTILQEGHVVDVPFIIGTTELETLLLTRVLTAGIVPENVEKALFTTTNKNPSALLGIRFNDFSPEVKKIIGKELKKFYFHNSPISQDTLLDVIKVTTDLNFLLGTHDVISHHLARGHSPVYHYYFTIDTDFGRLKKILDTPIKGPSHVDDLGYLFYMNLSPPPLNPEGEGYKAMLKMIKLWTNFAKYGKPTPNNELRVEWRPATAENRYYLDIGKELIIKEDVEKERMQFWDNLRMREGYYDL